MFIPSVGRWSSEDPKRFQAGDVNLDRYVGNDPTNATDPSGLQEQPKRSSEETKAESYFENKVTNLARAIKVDAMKKSDIQGKTITGRTPQDQEIRFQFENAYKGIYHLITAPTVFLYGVYVKIRVTLPKSKYDEIRLIQIAQRVTYLGRDPKGDLTTDEGLTNAQKKLGGLNDPNPKSRGWFVDAVGVARPFYGTTGVDVIWGGQDEKPAVIWDPPAIDALNNSSLGGHFVTAAIGFSNGKAEFLGAVRWGYYVYADGELKFDLPSSTRDKEATPVFVPTAPAELVAAIQRWNAQNPQKQVPSIKGIEIK